MASDWQRSVIALDARPSFKAGLVFSLPLCLSKLPPTFSAFCALYYYYTTSV